MKRWWKSLAEAWLRHAVPFDADFGGPFRPFEDPTPRRAGRTESTSRLEPGESICRTLIRPPSAAERAIGHRPPAA